MTDNDEEWKTWRWSWVAVASVVITLIVSLVVYQGYATKKFVEGGYCESTVVGHGSIVWAKCP